MTRAEKFIKIYNELSDHLSKLGGKSQGRSFYELVEMAAQKNKTIHRYESELKDYGNLRNAIVHHRTYPEQVIAEPNEQTVAKFQEILEKVLSPPELIPKFRKKIKCFSPDDKLQEALEYMKENDFSQILVKDGTKTSLLTAEGIARWLEKQVRDDIISVGEAKIKDALACDIPNSFNFLSRKSTIYDAQEAFSNAIKDGRPRLFAIIITEKGNAADTPLGLITPWDLLESGNF